MNPVRWIAPLLLAACLGPDDDLTVNRGDTDEEELVGRVSVDPMSVTLEGALETRVTATVVVQNVGDHPLTLVSATLPQDGGGVFETDEATNADRTLSPDRSFEVLVNCRLAEASQVAGTLRVVTDDPDAPEVDVALLCVPGEGDTDGA